MSTFEVKVYKLKIEPHTNADTLEIAMVNDYKSCVRKGEFCDGSLGVYLPEASIVPDWMLEKMNLVGRLSGSQKNRIKIIKLRGTISQGIVYPVHRTYSDRDDAFYIEGEDKNYPVNEGDEVGDLLGIRKYEPAIPSQLGGNNTKYRGNAPCIHFDVENLKKYNKVLEEGEEVVATEKIHGSMVCFGFGKHIKGSPYLVHSKGLGQRNISFQLNDSSILITVKKHVQSWIQSVYNVVMNLIDPKPYSNRRPLFDKDSNEAADNVYVKMFYSTIKPIFDKMKEDRYIVDYADVFDPHTSTVYESGIYFLGEIFGKSIQGGYDYGTLRPEFRCFDIYIGNPGAGRYLDYNEYVKVCTDYNIPMVPVIYRGPFSKENILKWTDGKETVSGRSVHIREGCVIKPIYERSHDGLGRVMLKSVSSQYLLKSDGEEFQ